MSEKIRCRAKDPLTCREHGGALARAFFAPFSQVRNAGGSGEGFARYLRQSEAVRQILPLEARWDLESYMGTGHSLVNSYLRGGKQGLIENILHEDYRGRERTPELLRRVERNAEELLPRARQRVAELDRAFELGERPGAARVLYRTVRVWSPSGGDTTSSAERKAYIAEHYAPGSIFTSKAYTSTSIDSDVMLAQARRRPSQLVVLEILTGRGLALHREQAGDIQHHEREVLLPRGMDFEVLGSGSALYAASGAGAELPAFFGQAPERKRYQVVQLREIAR